MKNLVCLVAGVLLFMVVAPTCLNYLDTKAAEENGERAEVVTVTTYTTSTNQTDSSPLITASGFKLHPRNPRKHRIIAVSRDLVRKLKFGQRVKLEGAGELNGVYVVQDVMNKRFRNRVDVLINPKDKPTMFKQAKIIIIN